MGVNLRDKLLLRDFRTKVLKKLSFYGLFLLLCVSGYGQDPISISDVAIVEGDAGTKVFIFTVSVDGGGTANSEIDFTFSTADISATAGSDYVAISGGNGIIADGATSTTLTVTVNGDIVVEGDETFAVNLFSDPLIATITDGTGLGTIINDDSQISIGTGVTLSEGNSGSTIFGFTLN
ncbi:MAG: Calx-beta domain-containing protein, partial [Eudoraea sp.]|uniref:Calx-beta domain-containing protein n=1 Tax=Eudoraea sp. TaxID=1979955 RepID=UPI003C746FC2